MGGRGGCDAVVEKEPPFITASMCACVDEHACVLRVRGPKTYKHITKGASHIHACAWVCG